MTGILPKINLLEMDSILASHTYDFQKALEGYVEAKAEVANCKLELEILESKEYLRIREDIEAFGKRPTEAQIAAEMKVQDSWINAREKLIKATKDFDRLHHLGEAYSKRESALRHLVALYSSQYWSLHGIEGEVIPVKEVSSSRFKERA